MTNLAKRQAPTRGANACFARTVLKSSVEQRVLLHFGYSDRARVFLNGQLLFVGDNSYASRDIGSLEQSGDLSNWSSRSTRGSTTS